MALTACRECGHQISDTAAACPSCGAPVSGGVVTTQATGRRFKGLQLAGVLIMSAGTVSCVAQGRGLVAARVGRQATCITAGMLLATSSTVRTRYAGSMRSLCTATASAPRITRSSFSRLPATRAASPRPRSRK